MAKVDRQARQAAAREVARAAADAASRKVEVVTDVAAKRRGATAEARKTYVRRETGLEVLTRTKMISADERSAGDRYARLFRMATLEDATVIRSFLDIGAGGGGTAAFPGQVDYQAAEAAARARAELAGARAALSFVDDMIFGCDMVCGLGYTPREILPDQRAAAELFTALRLALKILVRHFGDLDSQASGV